MQVSPGTKFGPYSVLSRLGRGGMGEVYRARDTRLDRIVAIKIVASDVAANATSRHRFEREARALSSLSHPNICSVFDVGDQDGIRYLVMEYLEGEALADRLLRGPLPLGDVIEYGKQIAAALDAAHRRGIIHRDLKPGNIMITSSGAKVLDFGLASRGGLYAGSDEVGTVTLDHPLTREGALIGTVPYMSPEQLECKEVDARSDIFALGVVLYEMATGRPAFAGGSHASVVARIMTTHPPLLSATDSGLPAPLDRLIRICLAKKREDRWSSAHDVVLQLEGIATADATLSETHTDSRSATKWKVAALIAAVVGFLLAGVIFYTSNRAPSSRVVASTIVPPDGHIFMFMGPFGPVGFSPDARSIAFVAASATEPPQIWVRDLDSSTSTRLAGTEGGYFPFWSPDGRFVAFFAGSKLKRIAVSGGSPITICDVDFGRGGSWNQRDQIIFGKFPGGIYVVPASGGTPVAVTTLDEARHDVTHRWPVFLPDGNKFLYMASNWGPENDQNAIFMGSLSGERAKLIVNASSNPYYWGDALFYVRERTIFAQPFDPSSGKLGGEPTQIVQGVAFDATTSDAAFAISKAGDLAYQPATAAVDFQLVELDSEGKTVQTVGEPGSAINPRVSPDGKRVLVSLIDRRSGQSNVWIYDLDRSTRTRLTVGGLRNLDAIWSPDGSSIAYVSYNNQRFSIFVRPVDGETKETLVYEGPQVTFEASIPNVAMHFIHTSAISPTSWTPDLKQIVFNERLLSGQWVVSIASADSHTARTPLLQATDTDFLDGEISPDGKWIAYESNESGHDEIYVALFPSLKQKQQVSLKGGYVPRWNKNGKALCYATPDKTITCADLAGGNESLHVAGVRSLFKLGFLVPFDVLGDRNRFVLATLVNSQNPAPLNLVTNWTSRLSK